MPRPPCLVRSPLRTEYRLRLQALGVSSTATVAALLPKDLHWRTADPGETPIGSSWWHMGRWCVDSLRYPFVRLVLEGKRGSRPGASSLVSPGQNRLGKILEISAACEATARMASGTARSRLGQDRPGSPRRCRLYYAPPWTTLVPLRVAVPPPPSHPCKAGSLWKADTALATGTPGRCCNSPWSAAQKTLILNRCGRSMLSPSQSLATEPACQMTSRLWPALSLPTLRQVAVCLNLDDCCFALPGPIDDSPQPRRSKQGQHATLAGTLVSSSW